MEGKAMILRNSRIILSSTSVSYSDAILNSLDQKGLEEAKINPNDIDHIQRHSQSFFPSNNKYHVHTLENLKKKNLGLDGIKVASIDDKQEEEKKEPSEPIDFKFDSVSIIDENKTSSSDDDDDDTVKHPPIHHAIDMATACVRIPFSQQLMDITRIPGLSFKYCDYSKKEHCINGCKTYPHSDIELKIMERIIRQVEFYFSHYNLRSDTHMLSRMDAEGWITCSEIFMYAKIRAIKPSFETFIRALRHSMHIRVSDDGNYVRSIYDPDKWRRYVQMHTRPADGRKSLCKCICTYNPVEMQAALNIQGIHQKMAKDFNKIVMKILGIYDPNLNPFKLRYAPTLNYQDLETPFWISYPNLSTARAPNW